MLFIIVCTVAMVTFVYAAIDKQHKIDQEDGNWDWHIKN